MSKHTQSKKDLTHTKESQAYDNDGTPQGSTVEDFKLLGRLGNFVSFIIWNKQVMELIVKFIRYDGWKMAKPTLSKKSNLIIYQRKKKKMQSMR